MTTLKVTIQNLKLIKTMDVLLEGGNMYMVTGSNGQGKTTFAEAIRMIMEGNSKNKQKTSFDASKGQVTGILTGADGETYKTVIEFSKTSSDKFTLYLPDGTKTTRKGDIANIFKYNYFTVEEFLAWGASAEGRRKQASMLLNLLPEDKRERISEIDIQVNTNDGKIYLKRRDIKNECEIIGGQMRANQLSEEEQQIVEELPQWEEALTESKNNAEDMTTVLHQKLRKNANYDYEMNRILDEEKLYLQKIDNWNKEIERLTKEIEQFQKAIEEGDKKKEELGERIPTEELEKESKELEEFKASLKADEEAILEGRQLRIKKEAYDKYSKELGDKMAESISIDKKIAELRDEKQQIIENIPGLEDLVIEDGSLYMKDQGNLLPFSEENVSYSQAGIPIFRLMMKLNSKFKIWLIGKAAEYDLEKIEEFRKLAEKTGGIIVADYVSPTPQGLTIEVVEKKS